MRKKEVECWIESLTATFGGSRAPIDEEPLSEAWEKGDFSEMVSIIKRHFGVTANLRLGLVNSGMGNTPAWVIMPEQLPLFGSSSLSRIQVTLFLRKSFIQEYGFESTVVAIAHEMSHIVLNSLWHPLRAQEEAVDLTAMLLGFRDFFITGSSLMQKSLNGSAVDRLGYLTREEISHAAEYMTFHNSAQ